MIERLYDNSRRSPRYHEAMKPIIAALDALWELPGAGDAGRLEALPDVYARAERAATLDALTEGFRIAAGLALDLLRYPDSGADG